MTYIEDLHGVESEHMGTLRVRVTPEELRAIESKSKAQKQTMSDWIRSTLNAAL